MGPAGGELGIAGFISAFDAKTGKELWRFNTIPAPGQPGHETWGGDSWQHGGGPVWVTGSYDPDLNLTYWGVGNPGPDYDGDVRPGDNLYTCSVIALDADTGKLKWHYQFMPHDEFDWDAVQVPVLADMTWQGRPRKVMLWANRNGFYYVLDRTSGQFLLGKPFVRQNWNVGFDEKGRPIKAPMTKTSKEGVLIYPGNQGGTNWFNPSYSPHTGLFYVNAWENTSTIFAKRDAEYQEGLGYTAGANRSIVPRLTGMGMRAPQGPNFRMEEENYSAVRALDLHALPDPQHLLLDLAPLDAVGVFEDEGVADPERFAVDFEGPLALLVLDPKIVADGHQPLLHLVAGRAAATAERLALLLPLFTPPSEPHDVAPFAGARRFWG